MSFADDLIPRGNSLSNNWTIRGDIKISDPVYYEWKLQLNHLKDVGPAHFSNQVKNLPQVVRGTSVTGNNQSQIKI